MAIAVPSLDDRAYADLVDEARALIPVYDPSWTNHNESDPGITLIELFAWLTEMQIYALDQITDEHRVTFLRLLNGPDLKPKRNADQTIDKIWLERETGKTLDRIRRPSRAISALDHEVLACQIPEVRRARCVPRRNLAAGNENLRSAVAPGTISIVILPQKTVSDGDALCKTVRERLEPARTLTTKLQVTLPVRVPIATRIIVARRSDVPEDTLKLRIQERLAQWLDPWTGGGDGMGWPFSRDVYISELNTVLEAVSGVDYVGETMLDSAVSNDDPQQQTAPPIWHDDSGALVGLAIADHHLPLSTPDAHHVLVADWLDPVRIAVTVTPSAGKTNEARRNVMQALREDLWSLQQTAYDKKQGFDLSEGRIRTLLNNTLAVMAVVSSVGAIVIEADPARKSKTADTAVYTFKAGEFFYAACTVDVAASAPAGATQ